MEVAEVLKGFDQQSHEESWGQSAVVGRDSSSWCLGEAGPVGGACLSRAWGAPSLL